MVSMPVKKLNIILVKKANLKVIFLTVKLMNEMMKKSVNRS